MRFWDSSAIIPLCLREPASGTVERLLRADEDMAVWWATRVECLSALARRLRDGTMSIEAGSKARAILSALASEWSEVLPGEALRRRAERLIMIHPLHAADSLQLAAALIWAQESPQGLDMICLDQTLREAAFKEGFTIFPQAAGVSAEL